MRAILSLQCESSWWFLFVCRCQKLVGWLHCLSPRNLHCAQKSSYQDRAKLLSDSVGQLPVQCVFYLGCWLFPTLVSHCNVLEPSHEAPYCRSNLWESSQQLVCLPNGGMTPCYCWWKEPHSLHHHSRVQTSFSNCHALHPHWDYARRRLSWQVLLRLHKRGRAFLGLGTRSRHPLGSHPSRRLRYWSLPNSCDWHIQ